MDGTLKLNKEDLRQSYINEAKHKRETIDLETLAAYRSEGMDLSEPCMVTFYHTFRTLAQFLSLINWATDSLW